jgi:uncharacterized membrane protein YfhO
MDVSEHIAKRVKDLKWVSLLSDKRDPIIQAIVDDPETKKFTDVIQHCQELLNNMGDDDVDVETRSSPFFQEHQNNIAHIIQSYKEGLNKWIDYQFWVYVKNFADEEAQKIKNSESVTVQVNYTQPIPQHLLQAMESSGEDFTFLVTHNPGDDENDVQET